MAIKSVDAFYCVLADFLIKINKMKNEIKRALKEYHQEERDFEKWNERKQIEWEEEYGKKDHWDETFVALVTIAICSLPFIIVYFLNE